MYIVLLDYKYLLTSQLMRELDYGWNLNNRNFFFFFLLFLAVLFCSNMRVAICNEDNQYRSMLHSYAKLLNSHGATMILPSLHSKGLHMLCRANITRIAENMHFLYK